MQLSPHFSLAELTVTGTGLANTPDEDEIARLRILAQFLEKVRALLGNRPITVDSAFRSEAVNEAVGGVPNSAHRLGFAADIVVDGLTPYEVATILDRAGKDGHLVFDQLILEQLPTPTWVHVARRYQYESDTPRMQRLTKAADGSYVAGIVRP
jgi:zinc D-Ala-D-Ala carboxypeptidase